MAWGWGRCRVCRREVRLIDLRWCRKLMCEACDECRRKVESQDD